VVSGIPLSGTSAVPDLLAATSAALRPPFDLERWWELSGDLFCVIGPDGRFQLVNPAWRRILGWSERELLGTSPLALVHPAGAAASRRRMLESGAETRYAGIEARYRHADGGYRWLLWSGYREEGHWYAVAKDITDRKRAEVAGEQSEQRLREAQRLAQIGSFVVDPAAGRVTCSDELHRLFQVDPGQLGNDLSRWLKLLPSADAALAMEHAARTVGDGEQRAFEHRYLRGDELRWAETRIEPLVDDDASAGLRGTVQDITDRKQAQREIHVQAHLLDSVQAAVIATDLEGIVTHWNGGAERLYGWLRTETIGRPIDVVTVGPEDAGLSARIMDCVREIGSWEGSFRVRRKDGTDFVADVRNALVFDPDGQPAGVVGVSVDVSEQIETQRQLKAARDYLRTVTDSMGEGVYTLDEAGRLIYINRAAEQMLGWKADELTGAVLHDRMHFRRPDGSPHPIEDCPMSQSRVKGEVVRVEDDVFIRKDGTELPVAYTASPFETTDGVRGSVVLFTDISQRKADERRLKRQIEAMSWVGRVRDALAEDRLTLYAQPIVDVATRQTVQHELLLRLVEPDGTLVEPGRFLPAAEECGLIVDIDRWVVGRAIELAGEGHAVELNLSARSVGSPALLEEFRTGFERTGADPSLIVVELTETAIVDDEATAEIFIDRIKAFGCKLALDDFGTGYGGFSYLKRLPVDYLKIDMEFVRDLPSNEASQHVVKAVVSLARGFGQRTVAEGVEDDETLTMLHDFGVDYAQGHAIARPAPADQVLA
jgi:PAS domain S-box-containing protein